MHFCPWMNIDFYVKMPLDWCTVDDCQVGHLSKTPLNLLEIHEIGPVDTSESKQQNYD